MDFTPDLSLKKKDAFKKVCVLEETVMKGTLEDLRAVLDTYKEFDITARALGLAARYRGLDFVKLLYEYNASFKYDRADRLIQRRYNTLFKTVSGDYKTEYYLMLVPEKLRIKDSNSYSPLNGIKAMGITPRQEKNALASDERLEIIKYLIENKRDDINLDEMLFLSLKNCEFDFADKLIEMGADLNKDAPAYYYSYPGINKKTYLDIISVGSSSVYWTDYINFMVSLESSNLLPVLERLNRLASLSGKKLLISQTMFDKIKWNDDSLAFIFRNADISKINQKQALEKATLSNFCSGLSIMLEAGWLNNIDKRDSLIELASKNNCTDALALLLDFKNRTADLKKEKEREEAKERRLLNEMLNPSSASAMRKICNYKKRKDGTLIITGYKGNAEEVIIPEKIGKTPVTAIDNGAFSTGFLYSRNEISKNRGKIEKIVIPGSVTEIGYSAFYGCTSLKSITITDGVRKIGAGAFKECTSLTSITIPDSVTKIGENAFDICKNLSSFSVGEKNRYYSADKFGILYNKKKTKIIMYPIGSSQSSCTIPDGVKEIGEYAFRLCCSLRNIIIPDSVTKIGKCAFCNCHFLKSITIPDSVTEIGYDAFYDCQFLTIHAHARSYAKKFAKQYKIPFIAID